MPRGLNVSRPIANLILFVNISKKIKWIFISIMTSSVAHWDTWGDNFA